MIKSEAHQIVKMRGVTKFLVDSKYIKLIESIRKDTGLESLVGI